MTRRSNRRDFLRTTGVPIAAGLSSLPALAKPLPTLSGGGFPQVGTNSLPIEMEMGCFPAIRVREAILFAFDDYSIPFTWGLRRQLIMGKKWGRPNPVVVHRGGPGEPDNESVRYYGSVVQIGDELRMFYLGRGDKAKMKGSASGLRPMYAVSKDGLHWEKPKLGLIEYNGNKQNNLLDFLGGEFAVSEYVVIHDPEDPDPSRRFKMVFECGKYKNRLAVACSPDGLSWKESAHNPVGSTLEESGLINFNGCYYVNGQGGGQYGSGRKMVTFASYDFEHWARPSVLSFRRGPLLEQPYEKTNTFEEVHLGASLINKGNVILGIYGMWHGTPSGDRSYVTMDLGLVVSNDGMHFREPIPDFRFMPDFEELELPVTVKAPSVAQGQGMANIGDKTLYWYEAWGNGLVRAASWERDRLGFFNAYVEEGSATPEGPAAELTSCLMRLSSGGGKVYLNADGLSEKAELTVEIQDREFRPVPGYTAKECDPIRVSGFRQAVTWKGNSDLSAFLHPIRVRVLFAGDRFNQIKLYAIYVAS